RIEWVGGVTGTAVLPTNPDTGPQYARTTCVVGQPCEILVLRPPMLEQGVPYWVRLSVFGYCEERYTGVQGSCGGDGNTVAAREFLADAAPGGSAVGPTAAFLATQANADAPWLFDPAGSTASAPATIVRYEWDLGDGFRTTSGRTTHEYAEPGRYHVTLKVTDSVGRFAIVSQDIGEADTALIVNSAGDAPRGPKAGDACDTGEKIRGKPECTLRAAIQTANLRDAASAITFAIRGQGIPVISHATKYPALAKPVIIDGTSQPGGWVQITGASNLKFSGLNVSGGDSRVTGLVISGFDVGLRLSGARNLVEGNRIGTNAGGTESDAAFFGLILNGATDTTIRDNVILANTHAISSSDGAGATVTHNHIGVTESGRATGLEAGIFVGASGDRGGPWTITDNTIQANRVGIFVRGAGATDSTISRNSILVTIPPSRAVTIGILIDGTPGVTVSDNPTIVAAGGYDIAVTGVIQSAALVEDGKGLIRLRVLDNEIAGTVTGGDVTIRNNTLGLAADGSVPGVRSRLGVVAYGAASNVHIEGNVIAGHGEIEIELYGGAGHQVTGNNVGVDRAGKAALGGPNGLFLSGVTDVLVQGNLISGIKYTAVSVGADDRAGDGPASRNVTLTGNRIGTATDTRVALGNGTGIRVDDSEDTVIGPDNVISGNETGIIAGEKARGLGILGNTIGADRARTTAVPNGMGIESSATGVTIEDNRVLGSTNSGVQLDRGTAEISGNEIGIGAGSKPLGNKVGVWVTGGATAEMGANVVAFNGEDGIRIDRGAHGFVLLGSTLQNGGKGIGGDGALAAPRLDVVDVGSGASARRWFVVSGIGGIRTAHIYGNPNCDDPNEGPVPLKANFHGANPLTGPTVVLSSAERRSFPGYTVTVTDAATKDTSVFSNCALPRQYPDTSATGIPDIIQRGLGGDPTLPATVRFPGDIGFITLETTRGRFAKVAPGATAPSGTDLPLGAFTFQVTGVTPGERDTVLLTSSDAVLRSYWRYGRETRSAPMRWFSWQYDNIGHTGPRLAGRQVILNIIEGGDGDDDGVANGVVQQ
ncbi:MAG: right-handed parallel beta-helix repeat-containing protein, partial [Chloroflexi bacterium]|nr:right-handed parallel beta-helix repeat-containing protein [Chloroflexota bacterium]